MDFFPILQRCFVRPTAQKTEMQGALADNPQGKKQPSTSELNNLQCLFWNKL